VSKGTLYLYYPSKEELLKAVVRSTLAVEVAEGARLLDEHQGSSTDALLGPLVDWWIRVYNSPASGVFKLLLTEMCNFPELAEFYAQEVLEPGMGVMARLLTQGVARGIPPHGHRDGRALHRHAVRDDVRAQALPRGLRFQGHAARGLHEGPHASAAPRLSGACRAWCRTSDRPQSHLE
jgi:AcrR family transcriptional regulator